MINGFVLQDDIIRKLYSLIRSSVIIRREKGTNFYEYNGIIYIDIPEVENEFFGTETDVYRSYNDISATKATL